MTVRHLHRRGFQVLLVVVFLSALVTVVQAQDDNKYTNYCELPSDEDIEYRFRPTPWIRRGECIRRKHGVHLTCGAVLSGTLDHLAKLREAEYAGAASVLSLLPTIGALFGPPTSEIWRLKSMVPIGGVLAMGLSFGGALMPVRAEDYDSAIPKDETAIGRHSLGKHAQAYRKDDPSMDEKLRELSDKIRMRVGRQESVRLPKTRVLLGLAFMFALFALAHSAMAVTELGAVVNFMCTMNWWMHLWYFLGKSCCVHN
jgi:hypothetical protein